MADAYTLLPYGTIRFLVITLIFGSLRDEDALSLDDKGLFQLVLDTCSGKYKTKQENHHDIAFFKKGVTL